ncbi:aminodeoxychorismate/anthranilate synthase component II [bacterium]|jgi:anthranilate synthase/aminodeoxychorismate synthase-like glutamine amidotransferase|nr:aminodeoxychorismate/anthranilate synthase component II [bacterium]MBT4291940.1 aminodeoxychorismate/anthranilate synthase component II [bacterium]MBT7310534.1 aminodeoxychorismate/anthranilate synthase component II [bacterium]
MKLLILDNFDSFTWNLVQMFDDVETTVKRNNEITLAEICAEIPDRIVISPGPGTPDRKWLGVCTEVIESCLTGELKGTPLLGVCLGHQGIITACGGTIVTAPEVMHGKTSFIKHNSRGLFSQLPDPLEVMRYHSLVAGIVPDILEVTATTDELVMAVRHRELPIFGVQFHPESIGTSHGKQILNTFLNYKYGV